MDVNFGEVFLGAFLGFLASYGVERLLAWESERSKAKSALDWVRREMADNLRVLESHMQARPDELKHGLFYDHQWQSAILAGSFTSVRTPALLGNIARVYRDLKDIEKWTSLVCELYFNPRTGDASRELARLREYVRTRQEQAHAEICALLDKAELKVP